MGLTAREPKTYATIISDGTIRVKTSESDPKAVKRHFKLSDGTEGDKWEQVYHELSGKIAGILFVGGNYGKTLNITVNDGEDIILQMSMQSNYAEDVMKKLPSLDLTQPVTFKPYSFEDSKKKLRRGISVIQGEVKIKSFFHDEKNNPINDFPAFTGDPKDKEDWKIYFLTTRKFLQKFIEDNIQPMFLLGTINSVTEAEPSLVDDDVAVPGDPF
jgi:hypothetical protein